MQGEARSTHGYLLKAGVWGAGMAPGEEILEGNSRLVLISKLPSSTRAVGVVAFDESALLNKPIRHPCLDLHRG